MKIEISFDDGHIGDLHAAEIMKRYGFNGTFYIPSLQTGKTTRMTEAELKQLLVMGMELGGHTFHHPHDMKLLSDDDLEFEIVENKEYLEKVTGKPVTKFCYPRGRHDQRVRDAVKAAGYQEARTTLVLKYRTDDPFQTPTTVHMFNRQEYEGTDWSLKAMQEFREALMLSRKDPTVFFSLWGHTQELESEVGGYDKFESVLAFMRQTLSTI